MTDYSALPARELDAAVAREVMGWTNIHPKAFDRTQGGKSRASWTEAHDTPWAGNDPVSGKRLKLPRYSTDWRAMGTVLDALRERGFEFNIESSESGWVVSAFPESIKQRMVSADDPSLPRAVCEAALAAVGGK